MQQLQNKGFNHLNILYIAIPLEEGAEILVWSRIINKKLLCLLVHKSIASSTTLFLKNLHKLAVQTHQNSVMQSLTQPHLCHGNFQIGIFSYDQIIQIDTVDQLNVT